MKPAPFEYHLPSSLGDAVKLLDTLDDARILAGGQSLIPMMNLRVVTPSHLVDLGQLSELCGINETASSLRIGAMTTQRQLERSELVRTCCPLLAAAVEHVGHQQTRNRGTIGGSLCHLDPGAELPVAAAALDAKLKVVGINGPRALRFEEFPDGYLTTSLDPGEILTEIEVRKAFPHEGHAFIEFNQRNADFAVVSVAILVTVVDERIGQIRIAVGGVSYAPIRLIEAEAALAGNSADDQTVDTAEEIASAVPCQGDEVSPAEFRQHLCGVLVRRALKQAIERAKAA
jgi:carbon-monoxide dehydrogenase medium subunit